MNQLWIEGLAHRDFEPTLRGLLGQDAPLSLRRSLAAKTGSGIIVEELLGTGHCESRKPHRCSSRIPSWWADDGPGLRSLMRCLYEVIENPSARDTDDVEEIAGSHGSPLMNTHT